MDVAGVSTFTGNIDANGDIDVDGHTNLDNVSIAGVTTITSSTFPLVVHADTSYQGILVHGNGAPTVSFAHQNTTTPDWKIGLSGGNHTALAISEGTGNTNRLTLSAGGGGSISGTFVAQHLGIDGYLYHNSDTNTKLQFGTDTIDLHTGGSSRLAISNTGVSIPQDLDVDGHTNLDNVSVGGATTMSGDLRIESALPSIYLTDTNNNPDWLLYNSNGNFEIRDPSSGTYFQVLSSGTVRSFGNFIAAKDLDVDGHTNLDNVSIAGVTTFSGGISGSTANLTGALTGTTANFSGNVTVGGVLTYEDVKNVDSIGIATARAGLNVSGGNVTIANDIDVNGHTNLDNVSIAGVTTGTTFKVPDSTGGDSSGATNNLSIGTGSDLKIFHNGSHTYIRNTTGVLHLDNYDGDIKIRPKDSEDGIKVITDGAVELYHNNVKRLETTSTGITVTGTVVATGADINGDLDVSGQANLSGFTTTTSYGLTTRDLYTSGITTVHKAFRVDGQSIGTGLMPFVVRHGGYQGIQTSLFTSTLNNYPELVLENTWNGNWNSSGPWKLKWTLPNEQELPAGDGRILSELQPIIKTKIQE